MSGSLESGAIALSLRQITYRARAGGVAGAQLTILDRVELDLRYGRLLALVGPNGAGKSSVVGVLAGDLHPASGTVHLDGRPLSEYSTRALARRRAVLLQTHDVSFAFRVREVVEMGRAPWIGSGSAAKDAALIHAALRHADIGHLSSRVFASLSGGERARAAFARVLAQDTRIVLLDEPTSALDLRHQEDTLRLARGLAREGRAVAVVLHDLSLAGAYADEIAMLDRGRVVACSTPEDVLTAARIEEVYRAPVRVSIDPDTGRPLVTPRRR